MNIDSVWLFLVSLADPATSSKADKNDDFDILELSIWYNSSSDWRAVNAAEDTIVTYSLDSPDENYIVGGYRSSVRQVWRTIQKLDLTYENSKWIELPNVTIPAHLATTHMGLVVQNKRLYMFTGQPDYGCGPATRASAYLDLLTHEWIKLPDVPEARYGAQVIITNNLVHLFGGTKPDRTTPASDYWMLNLDRLDQGWSSGPSIPQSGDHGQSALIDGWIYFFGFEYGHAALQTNHSGIWDGNKSVHCSGRYIAKPNVLKIDSKKITPSSRWIELANIPHPVSHAGSIVLNKKLVLLIGGIGPVGNRHAAHVQLFDSRSDDWRLLSPLPRRVKTPQFWTNREQSAIYLQPCTSSATCMIEQAHIIWSRKPETDKCSFYPNMNCTTRKLQRTPHLNQSHSREVKWTKLFSQMYLINLPKAVERLRRSWYELNRIDLTFITLIEGFLVPDLKSEPMLIRQDHISPGEIKRWKGENDTKYLSYYFRSIASIKLVYMHLWTKTIDSEVDRKPVLIMEDDIIFTRARDETFNIIEKCMRFLKEHTEIQWDLLYLGYRNIKATQTYEISQQPPIRLWRASNVFSNTGFIVNTDPHTIKRLNNCFTNRLSAADEAISFCLKHQLIIAYLIDPKLVKSIPGFSYRENKTKNYFEDNQQSHMLNKHTPRATFKAFTIY